MKDGPESKPGQMTLVDYGLATPERPLGNMQWSEFTTPVGDEDIRMLTALWNILNRLNSKYQSAVNSIDRGYAPHAEDDLGRYGKPFLSKPTKVSSEEKSSRGEAIIDVDELYILTRTNELDKVPGVGKKTVVFTINLLNQNIANQAE